jgi:hypothetical protein
MTTTTWTPMTEGTSTARTGELTLRVTLLPSGSWLASVSLDGACATCLGDAFPDAQAARAACEREARS